MVKGGDQFFLVGQRGGPKIFEGQRGGGDQNFFLNFFLRLWRNSLLDTLSKNFLRLRRNLSLYHTSSHITCSYIISFFSQPPGHSLFSIITAPSIVCVRGMFFRIGEGGPEFFHEAKGGGTKIFPRRQRGGPNFFYVCKGGDQKKLATGHHRQTPPLPVKNDSSLRPLSHPV